MWENRRAEKDCYLFNSFNDTENTLTKRPGGRGEEGGNGRTWHLT